jgi:replication fork clamp-binding protein CrfC
VFEEIPGKQFTDFLEVRAKIDELTDSVAGKTKNIVDKPILLRIHSPTCPDLSLIDLPGITRIPLANSGQPNNIEEVTKRMALRYVLDKRTIILCVIPANIDLTTSEALQISRKADTPGLRTIGVITKIDIMDKGTNAKKTLMGQEVPLKLGYVGVKLRSQQDILDKKNVQAALEVCRFSKP